MQKKHFEFIASVIKAMPSFAPNLRAQKASCASAFAVALAKTNPRFDATKFIKACDVAPDCDGVPIWVKD